MLMMAEFRLFFHTSFLDISSLIGGIPQMFVVGKKEEMERGWEGGGRREGGGSLRKSSVRFNPMDM